MPDTPLTHFAVTGAYVGPFTFMTITSDRSLKEQINPIHDSSEVLKLKPVSFIMKGGKKLQFGFIAQDIEETEISNIVFHNDRGVRSVAYNQIIPLLLHQIQQLTQRVAALESSLI